MNKIKVLHTEWSGGWGGQEIRILNEMRTMRDHGVEVSLASTAHAKITEHAEKHQIPCFKLSFAGNADLKTLWGLYKIIKTQQIDIVNTHSGKDTWVGGLAAKMAGAKFIRTRHLSNAINPSRLNFINELADYVITTGESVREAMILNNRIKAHKICSIPTGINEKLFNAIHYNRAQLREKFGIKEEEFAIGIIAVLRRFKRHDLFIEMAKQIGEEFPNAKFFIAGDGPQRETIIEKIKHYALNQKIVMLGHLAQPAELLAALDLFILSSEGFEGVPQAVMQALFMERPVIATNAGSTRDLWHEHNFRLIEENSLEALVNSVRELMNDSVLRTHYQNNARAYVVQNFSETQMATKLLTIYKQLLGNNNANS